ncbi:hypothetical protein Ahy_A07g036489 isoform B [Arachis hypogaea]|uniref:Uncharacterized protein n=1 Tax=Arachis hypogaea TaxID=3818 RepID=A0A445CGB3_ARAHY|nr:hypothetical protein Ahy_A07g036489 isoform B [Arachis hypogaea]
MYIGNGKGNEHDREAGGFEETREPDAFSAVYEVEAHNEWAAGVVFMVDDWFGCSSLPSVSTIALDS